MACRECYEVLIINTGEVETSIERKDFICGIQRMLWRSSAVVFSFTHFVLAKTKIRRLYLILTYANKKKQQQQNESKDARTCVIYYNY